MNLLKNIIKKTLGALFIASWILLIWKKHGEEDVGTIYLYLLGILYAMAYAPWLYACFNTKGKFSLLPPLPKTFLNVLWNINVIANLFPAMLGLLVFFPSSSGYQDEDFIVIVLFFLFGGLGYWYLSYIVYFLMQGFSRSKWGKVCLCIGLLMILLPIIVFILQYYISLNSE